MSEIRWISVKQMLIPQRQSDIWFECKYALNIYRGCNHGCIYCDSRSDCYQIDAFDRVAVKANALEILEQELKSKRQGAVVGLGAMSDPYNSLEEQLEYTRQALALLDKYGFGVHIATKSDLIARDADILRRIADHSPVSLAFSLSTADDSLASILEPGAPSPSRRLQAMGILAAEGLLAGVLMMPALPFICDTEDGVKNLVSLAAARRAAFIYACLGVTLRTGQREHFYQCLDERFPGIRAKYQALYGSSYECMSPEASRLWKLFRSLCEQHGILYSIAAINAESRKRVVPIQPGLFDE